MHTRSVVFIFRPESSSGQAFEQVPLELREDVLARLGTVIRNVAPVFLLCDRNDIGVAERLRDPHFEKPALYIYDRYPGGTGLAEGLVSRRNEILDASLELIRSCPCSEGCPSCVGADEKSGTEGNRKEAVLTFLEGWQQV